MKTITINFIEKKAIPFKHPGKRISYSGYDLVNLLEEYHQFVLDHLLEYSTDTKISTDTEGRVWFCQLLS